MSQASVPAAIEDKRRRIASIDTELRILAREAASGADCEARQSELAVERTGVEAELAALDGRWAEERGLAAEIAGLRAVLEDAASTADRTAERERLMALSRALREMQGEHPLIFPLVDGQAVAEIVESWTGIPAGRMRGDEIRTVLGMQDAMQRRVIGQSHAMDSVSQAIHTARAKLTDPRKPIAVFLMVGTSGVGKTETALALADLLYGGEQNLTVDQHERVQGGA